MTAMRIRILTVLSLLLALSPVWGQVTADPALPTDNKPVKITFNAAEGTGGLAGYTGDVYAHTGVLTNLSADNTNWRYVKTEWGENTPETKLTRIADDLYELTLSPTIRAYYGVPDTETITHLCFVFRSADNSKEGKATGGKDIFVETYEEGLNVSIDSPTHPFIAQQNVSFPVSVNASVSAHLELFLNDELLTSVSGSTTLNHEITLTNPGDYWLKVVATTASAEAEDSVYITIPKAVSEVALPAGVRDGINYISDTEVTLVLYAPEKETVHLIGDFNDWIPTNDYLMNRDGDRYWITLTDLEAGREYLFQYLVDGQIKIADPYTEKTCDPWNDDDIPAETYPDLPQYPSMKTDGIAAVFQTAQTPYAWEVADFETPKPDTMAIYELHIRDFDERHSYASVIDRLDYLEDLEINVLELMPINEFEGNSSWGYNPSFYFAPDKYYGPKDDLKRLIDACHKRGIAVIIDLVLNHSYGQSPFVQLYFDGDKPAANNPWYNQSSNFENSSLQWGYDFNHESEATRALVDSINSFWMSEYKVDGFRFDFTKGFSNNIKYDASDSWGSLYDADRIANLERMADEIWKREDDAIVIFEHLSDNAEEKELAEYGNGILLWGNNNHNANEASMGYTESNKSDLSWSVYSQRSWNKPGVVAYMESHDEERLMYKNLQYGKVTDSYSVKELETALERMELTSALFYLIPGPKMVWQFGELGYDVSIDEPCRVCEKPIHWEYLDNPDRTDLFQTIATTFFLKKNYPIFSSTDFSYSLTGAQKFIKFNLEEEHVVLVGNFDVVSATMSPLFQQLGTWYEYFTDSELTVSTTNQSLTLAPGEFRLYSTSPFEKADIETDINETRRPAGSLRLYPNPCGNEISVQSDAAISELSIYLLSGAKVKTIHADQFQQSIQNIDLSDLGTGCYLVEVIDVHGHREMQKLLKH